MLSATPLMPPAAILLWDRKLEEKQCEPITVFDDSLRELVQKLKATCYAHNGAGIAAPQIGEFVRVAVIHCPQEKEAWPIINPIIDEINSKGEQIAHEGCLSLPLANTVNVRVRRCNEIFYSYHDINGERHEDRATGFLARAIAHETDHLAGLFYTDRVGDLTRSLVMKSYQKFLNANPALGGRYRK